MEFFFFSTGGVNSSQPASGCVFLRHMCECGWGKEKTAGSRDKPVSHSDHIRSVETHWSTASLMGNALQGCEAGQMTYRRRDTGEEGRKNRGWCIPILMHSMLLKHAYNYERQLGPHYGPIIQKHHTITDLHAHTPAPYRRTQMHLLTCMPLMLP